MSVQIVALLCLAFFPIYRFVGDNGLDVLLARDWVASRLYVVCEERVKGLGCWMGCWMVCMYICI